MELAMVQDVIVPMDKLDPAYMDRGTYFGDGVYEVVRSYDGTIFALDAHLQRLAQSLTAIQIAGVDIDQLGERINRAYRQADIPDAKIYFHVTRGAERRSHVESKALEPNFFLTITAAPDSTNEKARGIAVSTHPDLRWKRCDIKSLNLLPNILARKAAEQEGCAEAILVGDDGKITEGAGSAFFMILAASAELVTRPLGPEILPSITRNFVLQLAPQAGLRVIEKAITPSQATRADELFIAVTTKDIVPVIRFNDQKIGTAAPGNFTKDLIQKFTKLTHSRR
jgi:D-alanine transaminase